LYLSVAHPPAALQGFDEREPRAARTWGVRSGPQAPPALPGFRRYGRVSSNPAEFSHWLVGSLRTGLLAVDGDGRLALISPEAVRVLELGGDPAAQVGRPAAEVLAPHPALLALLTEAQKGRELPSRAELELVLGGGRERRPIGFTLVPVRDASGVTRGAALLFRDLTPFERQDEQARLRDRLAALGQMAAGLAHEIRNPLASLQVLADLLKRSLGERPEESELVEEIRGELETLTRLVNGRLSFVRPHAAMRAPVELEALVHEALRRARARVPFAGEIEVDVAAQLRPSLDALQLESLLVNLIVNAFEAMHELPSGHPRLLRIEATEQGGELRLAVADSGPGVPAPDRERVFYPFFTTRDSGTGVGLAEVHKAVVSHGGSVEVRERVGGGAVFLIHLPLEEWT
jgi:signal transduction histidine kinase